MRSRDEMEGYVTLCEKLTAENFYAVRNNAETAFSVGDRRGATITWPSPINTNFPANNTARADLFPCARGWRAPTVLMLHALMSASHVGYRRYATRFNELGWNACFVHLPYHYSRVPRGYWNGELAITADLIRNAEGLRQAVIELRQLMAKLRERGCEEFGVLGTSYGGWIGALLALVEPDFRFVALMAPIVNVEHAIWESPAARFMRRELRRANIELISRCATFSFKLTNAQSAAMRSSSRSVRRRRIRLNRATRRCRGRFTENGAAQSCCVCRKDTSAIACYARQWRD